MRRSRRLSEDEFGKVEEEMFGEEGSAGERNEEEMTEEPKSEPKPPVPVKGVKTIPKFKSWGEREKYFMKHK